jgi:ACR3 family arsenite transporter
MSKVQWLERHQIGIYLGALAAGAGMGLAAPAVAPVWQSAIYPVLGALLSAK